MKEVKLNLDAPLSQLNIRLKHLSEILKIADIAIENISDEQYKKYHRFVDFDVASSCKLNFSEARDIFYQWCLKNNFRDSVEYSGIFLEECNFVCELVQARSDNKIKAGDFNKICGENRKKFHKKTFPEKIEYLRNQYNVSSAIEDYILSLNKARNCLVHRDGVVDKIDLNISEALKIKYREIQIVIQPADGSEEKIIDKPMTEATKVASSVAMRFVDYERIFKLGEQIKFSPQEHIKTISTFWFFAQDIYRGICKYAGLTNSTGWPSDKL